ncbi:PH domain-containing protein [Aliikangiella marina]|uniref:PH domain-containing protein n=1 Tax=Aliikangiella marina TaxID=1712262 RepID=A0A545TIR2_9GAMM|nr:PH domain-containing protein [Aliikangiella marina]TQV77112.1 PH domain-containing protein [Aliikangiella marina]
MEEYFNNRVTLDSLPKLESLEFQPLEAKYAFLSSVETLLGWLFVLVPFTIIKLFVKPELLPYWSFLIVAAIAILSALFAYFSAKAKGYVLRDRDVLYKQGIWWQKRTGVSFKRIQHIDITHGPIERKFELATIKFFTAGGSLADLSISGLPKSYAEKMRAIIMDKVGSQQDG